jgi:hypothetical protein
MSLKTRLDALITAIGADIKALTTGKVAVVAGKGLSTNDYTTSEQSKLSGLSLPGFDKETVNASAGGAVSLQVSSATVFEYTLTSNLTLSFTSLPSLTGQSYSFVIRLITGATKFTVTWPGATIQWINTGGAAGETAAVGKMVEFVFTYKGSNTYIARRVTQ